MPVTGGKSGLLPWTTPALKAKARTLTKALPGAAVRSAGSLMNGAASMLFAEYGRAFVLYDSTSGILTATSDFALRSRLVAALNDMQASWPADSLCWESYWPYTIQSPFYVGEGNEPLPIDGELWWQHFTYFQRANGQFQSFGFEWPNHYRMNATRFVNFALTAATYPENLDAAGLVLMLSVGGPAYTIWPKANSNGSPVEMAAANHLLVVGCLDSRTLEADWHKLIFNTRLPAATPQVCLVADVRAAGLAAATQSSPTAGLGADVNFSGYLTDQYWAAIAAQAAVEPEGDYLESGKYPAWFDLDVPGLTPPAPLWLPYWLADDGTALLCPTDAGWEPLEIAA